MDIIILYYIRLPYGRWLMLNILRINFIRFMMMIIHELITFNALLIKKFCCNAKSIFKSLRSLLYHLLFTFYIVNIKMRLFIVYVFVTLIMTFCRSSGHRQEAKFPFIPKECVVHTAKWMRSLVKPQNNQTCIEWL